jgi:ABC-type lipoprotein release transport system permease subunit
LFTGEANLASFRLETHVITYFLAVMTVIFVLSVLWGFYKDLRDKTLFPDSEDEMSKKGFIRDDSKEDNICLKEEK